MADEENKAEIRTKRINRGNAAGHILEHPVFKEAITALREHNYNLFCSTPDDAPQNVRDSLWAKKAAIDAIEAQLEAFRQIGLVEVAEQQAERLETEQEME